MSLAVNKILFSILIIVIIFCVVPTNSQIICDGVHLEKGIGYIVIIPDKMVDRKEGVQHYRVSPEDCAHLATITPWCVQADFHYLVGPKPGSGLCRLFNSTYPMVSPPFYNNYIVYLWRSCDFLCYKFDGWCSGHWLRRPGLECDKQRAPIYQGTAISVSHCLELCQSPAYKHVCHSVNFNGNISHNNCIINLSWPLGNFQITDLKDWWSIEWECCDEQTYQEKKTCENHSPAFSCSGYWKFQSQFIIPPKAARYLTQIYTISWQDCIRACTLQPFCVKPWYLSFAYLCLLQAGNSTNVACAETNEKMSKLMYVTWEWKCCSGQLPRITTIDRTDESCVCLAEYAEFSPICIKPDNCSLPSSLPVKCMKFLGGTAFMKTNHEVRFENKIWKQVWNGNEYLWMTYTDDNLVQPCDIEQCKIFSGAVKPDYRLTIFKRREWFAQNPRYCKELPPFHSLPNAVVIVNTEISPCGCYSTFSCSNKMRKLQIRAFQSAGRKCCDIWYHFAIGSDGIVYEGIGWSYRSTQTTNYNEFSIIIAFIGKFTDNSPTLVALTAAKQLIALGFKNKSISTLYSVRGARDFDPHDHSKYNKLYAIIHNWPRYWGYESQRECPSDFLRKITVIASSTAATVVLLLLALIIAVLYKKDRFHTKWCRLLRKTYQFHVRQPGGVRLTLVPLRPHEQQENWPDLDILPMDVHPNNLEMSLENADTFLLSESEKLSCRCLFHVQQLAQFAKECECSFFIAMANNYHILEQCCLNTCIFLILPHDVMELVTIVFCHVQDPNNIRIAANAIRSNSCLCGEFQLRRVKYGFEMVKDKYREVTHRVGRPILSPDDKRKQYSIERERFERARKQIGGREVRYRMYGLNNLRQLIVPNNIQPDSEIAFSAMGH